MYLAYSPTNTDIDLTKKLHPATFILNNLAILTTPPY